MPTQAERLAALERTVHGMNVLTEERENQRVERAEERRRAEEAILVRLDNLEAAVESLTKDVHVMIKETKSHVRRATCINGAAKVLQGAGAGGPLLVAIYILLEKFGLL